MSLTEELKASVLALTDARLSLAVAEDIVVEALASVTVADDVDIAKAETVAGISRAINELTVILQTLE